MASLTIADVFYAAKAAGVHPVRAAIQLEYKNLLDHHLWPIPVMEDVADFEFKTKDIVSMEGGRHDLLSQCSRDISKTVQFPVSTAFMHGMGIIATAMTTGFNYNYYDTPKKVNLYIVTSQPTGAGKSAMNDYFYKAVESEYLRIASANRKERRRCIIKIEQYEEQLKTAKKVDEILTLENDIQCEREKMNAFPVYTYTWTDITPEALEVCAAQQNGFFNLVSDEATIINSLLGDMYSDRVKNNEMLLKGWDGDLVSSARVSRKGFNGYPNGNVAVCAQDETIKAILFAGERGNGICQRFLIHREPTMMGKRNYSTVKYHPKDKTLHAKYHRLINALMSEDSVVLEFHPDAMKFIHVVKDKYEMTIGDGGSNSQEMLRGVVAKLDKQIMKMSCILHALGEWGDGGNKSKTITEDTVIWAFSIYESLLESYINSASSQGFIGKNVEVTKVKEKITFFMEKGAKTISIQKLKDAVKNINPFKGHQKLVQRLRVDILPQLEEDGWIIVNGNEIIINPKLR